MTKQKIERIERKLELARRAVAVRAQLQAAACKRLGWLTLGVVDGVALGGSWKRSDGSVAPLTIWDCNGMAENWRRYLAADAKAEAAARLDVAGLERGLAFQLRCAPHLVPGLANEASRG